MTARRVALAAAAVAILGAAGVPAAAAGLRPAPNATPVSVSAGAVTSGINLVLQHGTGSISGRLVSAATQSPILGEVVSATGPDFAEYGAGATDRDGRFTIDDVGPAPGGLYLCTNELEDVPDVGGLPSECFPNAYWNPTGKIPAGASLIVLADGEHKDVGTMEIAAGSTIEGRVRTAVGNHPTSSDIVVRSISDPSLTFDYGGLWGNGTDAHGRYSFPMLPPSPRGWQVCFRNSLPYVRSEKRGSFGYLNSCYRNSPWRRPHLPARSTPVKVAPGQTISKINGTAKVGGRLTGLVTDTRGKRLDVLIDIYDAQHRLLASGDSEHGRYTTVGLHRLREVKVCATPRHGQGYVARCRTKRVTTHAHTTARGPDLALRKIAHFGASISGTVTTANSSSPVDRADVVAYDKDGTDVGGGRTGVHGRYHVRGLVGHRRYLVCVVTIDSQTTDPTPPSSECYHSGGWNVGDPPTAKHRILLRRTRTVNFALPPGGTISGTVTAADTGSGMSAEMYLYTARGNPAGQTWSANNGDFSISGLAPGNYLLCVMGASAYPQDTGRYLGQCYSQAFWPY